MPELTEDVLAPDVVVRRSPTTEALVRPGTAGQPPLVGAGDGALWARAEPGTDGLDIGHGGVNAVVRAGTVLFDARGGAGLVIVLRGAVEISTGGVTAVTARAGEAVGFDASGQVAAPSPVDAAELAQDPFICLNLVLDSLAGVPIALPAPPEAAPGPAERDAPEGRRRRFGGRTRG